MCRFSIDTIRPATARIIINSSYVLISILLLSSLRTENRSRSAGCLDKYIILCCVLQIQIRKNGQKKPGNIDFRASFVWSIGDSNPWPQQCECCALPTALMPLTIIYFSTIWENVKNKMNEVVPERTGRVFNQFVLHKAIQPGHETCRPSQYWVRIGCLTSGRER